MGSPAKEPGRSPDEKQHNVLIKNGFFLQTTETTVAQWKTFVRETGYKTEAERLEGAWVKSNEGWEKKKGIYWNNPGFKQNENHPVTCVSYNDVMAFLKWLKKKDGHSYRLPYEAEWEYACRAGNTTAFAGGPIKETKCDKDKVLDAMGWYCGNSGGGSLPVASKKPNNWGLYDMHGNVWEWCKSWYAPYQSGKDADYTDPDWGLLRVGRGGGWSSFAYECRSAYRYGGFPGRRTNNLGFRLVMIPSAGSDLEKFAADPIVLLSEQFDNNQLKWPESNDDRIFAAVENGKYIIRKKDCSGVYIALKETNLTGFDNYTVECALSIKDASETAGQYGIVWGAGNKENYTHFTVDAAGNYEYTKTADGQAIHILNAKSAAIKRKRNILKIRIKDNAIEFFINGKFVNKSEALFFMGNNVGIYIEGCRNVEVDYLVINKYL